jgi:hypothetical protein
MDPATQAQIDAARRLNGSIVVGLGPGGCGKTETLSRLSMACAFFNGISWYGYDSNGDLLIHLNRVSEAHAKGVREARTTEEATLQRRKLEFAEQCKSNLFRGPATLEKLKASVTSMIADGLRGIASGKPKKPRAVLFIDEAGAVRDFDDEFWSAMRQARNAGLTLYSTGHRLVDYHPSARTNIRVLLLWMPVDAKFYDINGVKIARERCTPIRSERIHYFVGGDPTPMVWDRGRFPNHYPAALITPATPTQGRVLGF